MAPMRMILNQAQLGAFRTIGKRSLMAGTTTIMLIGMATAFGTAPDTETYQGRFSDAIEQIAIPSFELTTDAPDSYAREIRIQRGDTVASLFSRMDIQDDSALAFLYSNREADTIFRQLAPGKTLSAEVSQDGNLRSLVFPLNGGNNTALVVQRSADGGLTAQVQNLSPEKHLVMKSATIRHSLFGAADDAGIPDNIAIELANIFGGDIDFHRDLRKGDRFSVIYETENLQGRSVNSGRILAAEFVNDGKTFHAFWHQTSAGKGGYYSASGQSLKKEFLRSPLEFSRITSGFSNARYHPVLRETRAHRGIDYGAPTGTRVKATGDGVIDLAGVQGGYGKVVFIRHSGNRTTVYGHLSGFASGIRKGARVSQGEVIGYVGSTGLATGPHLHYEFRIAGVHRNPLTVTLPQAEPMPSAQLPEFRTQVASLMSQIESIKDMKLVMLD
jgi:murein DD-endopeptidase MepM/ murein hydrolase activator NlpD